MWFWFSNHHFQNYFDFKSPLFRWFDFDFKIINIWWFCPSLIVGSINNYFYDLSDRSICINQGPFPLNSRATHKSSDTQNAVSRTNTYPATHLCWVLDSVSPTHSRLSVGNDYVALLQASMADFQREGTLQLIEE